MIEPYINLGWHTVPLSGQLTRLDDGTKTIPVFPENWRAKYQEEFNTNNASLGGAITGEVSDIIAIDCDNELTWNLFRSLDPEYEFVFLSKGKGYSAGTIIYRYTPDLAESFSINDGEMALDFYSNRGFIYLATPSNRTKIPLATPLPDIKEIPLAIALLIKQLAKKQIVPTKAPTTVNMLTANCLAPIVQQFVRDRKFMPGLFKVITPKSFRDLPEYITNGFLHPQDVPDGNGSAYLSQVSAILGADISIDEELYVNAMTEINNLFTDPMNHKRLDSTIINPMVDKKASVDGVPIWKYDEEWQRHRAILISKRQSTLELCFDDARLMYYIVDSENETIKAFSRDSEFMAYIEAAAVNTPKKMDLKKSLPIANACTKPNLAFGFNQGEDPTARLLNTFIQTPELMIFNNPDAYVQKYKHPITIIKYFETLIPEDHIRAYVLSFLHTKLKTFSYSPVILYFLGVPGSGKDTFVNIIEHIVGKIARPTVKEFLEMFNGWLLDTYFVQLDEYGDQLATVREKEEAKGKIKAYTGKSTVQIRKMRTEGDNYQHFNTFIMTANTNPLMIDEDDRRMCFIETPNILANQDWVVERGGIAAVHKLIMSEIKDFCYYLATVIKPLAPSAYVQPPEANKKHTLIANSMPAAQKISYMIRKNMLDELAELSLDHEMDCANDIRAGHITTDMLNDLYDSMTDFKGNHRTLFKILRTTGVKLQPTTLGGAKTYRVCDIDKFGALE